MNSSELDAIRAKRMSEMKQGQGQQGQEAEAQQNDDRKASMLAQILTSDARERLSRIMIVKPEKAKGVEEMLIRMVQSGQIRGQVTETQLVDLLSQVKESGPKITFARRQEVDSDEELLAQLR